MRVLRLHVQLVQRMWMLTLSLQTLLLVVVVVRCKRTKSRLDCCDC